MNEYLKSKFEEFESENPYFKFIIPLLFSLIFSINTTWLLITITIIGVEIFAIWRNKKIYRSENYIALWKKIYPYKYLIGIITGSLSIFCSYHLTIDGEKYHMFGAPILAYATSENGAPFENPLAILSILGNYLLWFGIPELLLYIFSFLCHEKKVA